MLPWNKTGSVCSSKYLHKTTIIYHVIFSCDSCVVSNQSVLFKKCHT